MSTFDISKYQGVVSVATFQAIRALGYERVILKLGGGDDGRYKDSLHDVNAANAHAAGLIVEGYWFNGTTDAAGDAAFACSIGAPGERIWFDVENEGSMAHWTPAQLLVAARAAQAAGHPVGAYMSSSVTFAADWSACTWMPLWVANYSASSVPSVGHWSGAVLWQDTSTGHLPGIPGYVDLDVDITTITDTEEDDMFTDSDRSLLTQISNAVFVGGPSMQDHGRSISASLATIAATVTQPVQRTINGKAVAIAQIQDNADSNTMLRQIVAEWGGFQSVLATIAAHDGSTGATLDEATLEAAAKAGAEAALEHLTLQAVVPAAAATAATPSAS